MNLVCLDSHYFQWGILLTSRESQVDKIPAAVDFFSWLEKTDATVIVPTPLITELLMGATVEERLKVLKALDERFYVKEFDIQAAKFAADVWNQKRSTGEIQEIIASGVSLRTKIKIDIQILGVAMAAKATVLYTEDGDFAKLADGFLIARPMPVQLQTTFFPALDSPIVSEQPPEQSETAPQEQDVQPEPSHPSVPQADQAPPPQGSFPSQSAAAPEQ